MLRYTLGFALAIATTALIVSCGSDSEDKGNNNNNVTQDSGVEPGIACGSTRCVAREGTTETPCCQDRFSGTCGVQGPTGACGAAPPMEDPRCPSVDVPVIGRLTSCCTTSNQCGVIAPAGFGDGCTELSEAQRRANQYTSGDSGFDAAGFMITFPPPKACN